MIRETTLVKLLCSAADIHPNSCRYRQASKWRDPEVAGGAAGNLPEHMRRVRCACFVPHTHLQLQGLSAAGVTASPAGGPGQGGRPEVQRAAGRTNEI